MIIKKIDQLSCCILILCIFQGCFVPSRYLMRKNLFIWQPDISCTPIEDTSLYITVWVHGTRLFSRPLYYYHFKSKPGLAHAYEIDHHYKLRTIAHALIESDQHRFDSEHFYLFSWSGKLCFKEREDAARALHAELEHLLEQYKMLNLKPKLRIICHSHGGNVALNLANTEHTFDIDELILLACPVQSKNKHLIRNSMFKKIYAFYSALDILQILDPQGMYKHNNKATPLFSKRQFLHQDNLAQLKIKINRRAITHSEFAQTSFLKMLPHILDTVSQWHNTIMYNENPNKISKLLCVYTKNLKNNSDRKNRHESTI